VNNAGGVLGREFLPIEETDYQDWRAILAVNLDAAFLTIRAAATAMKRAGTGRIINISSGAGLRASRTGIQAYTSAKHAVIGLTRQLAQELGPHGITVNAVAPGLFPVSAGTWKQWNSYGPEKQQQVIQGLALRRLGEAEDIAKAVLFFASDLADYVTGQVLPVNGGSF
jgi:3-oxoacyl-[acyl-carrier protein] reductase